MTAGACACDSSFDLATAPVSGAPAVPLPPKCALTAKVLVRIMGLPDGVAPSVRIGGYVNGYSAETIYATGTVPLPSSSEWSVQADWVATPDPIVRRLYRPEVSPKQPECDGTGASVDVVYVENPASGKLWLAGDPDVGFRSAVLDRPGTPHASVLAGRALGGIAFDRDGNLWGTGAASDGPTIVRYPAAALRTSDDKPPDLEAYVAGSGCTPFAAAIALRSTPTAGDTIDSVWVSQPCEHRVVGIPFADVAAATADAAYEPPYAVTGLTDPRGIAFDQVGVLWIADGDGGVVRVDPVTAKSGEMAPRTPFVVTPGTPSEELAFDSGGNLWIVGASTLVRVDRDDLFDDGVLTPVVRIDLGVAAKPSGIAFDETAGLWIAGAPSPGAIARFAYEQQTSPSTTPTQIVPERVIESSDVRTAGFPAFYPAPVGVPLQSGKRP